MSLLSRYDVHTDDRDIGCQCSHVTNRHHWPLLRRLHTILEEGEIPLRYLSQSVEFHIPPNR